jgi:hypothetical protein
VTASRTPNGDRLKIAASDAAVGRITLLQHEQFPGTVCDGLRSSTEEAAHVGQAVLLRRKDTSVCQLEHCVNDGIERHVRIILFTFSDEPSVLGKPAGIQIQRYPFVATSTSLVLSTALFDRIMIPHLAHDER